MIKLKSLLVWILLKHKLILLLLYQVKSLTYLKVLDLTEVQLLSIKLKKRFVIILHTYNNYKVLLYCAFLLGRFLSL